MKTQRKERHLSYIRFCIFIDFPLTNIELTRVKQIVFYAFVYVRTARNKIPAFTFKSKPYLVEEQLCSSR